MTKASGEDFRARANSNPRHRVDQQWNAATGETQYPFCKVFVCTLFCGQHTKTRNKSDHLVLQKLEPVSHCNIPAFQLWPVCKERFRRSVEVMCQI